MFNIIDNISKVFETCDNPFNIFWELLWLFMWVQKLFVWKEKYFKPHSRLPKTTLAVSLHTEFESENQTFLENLLLEKNEEIAQLDSKTNERYGNELRFTEELVNEKKGNIVSGSDLLLLLLSNNDGVGQIKINQKPEVPIKPFSISKYDKCLEDEKEQHEEMIRRRQREKEIKLYILNVLSPRLT